MDASVPSISKWHFSGAVPMDHPTLRSHLPRCPCQVWPRPPAPATSATRGPSLRHKTLCSVRPWIKITIYIYIYTYICIYLYIYMGGNYKWSRNCMFISYYIISFLTFSHSLSFCLPSNTWRKWSWIIASSHLKSHYCSCGTVDNKDGFPWLLEVGSSHFLRTRRNSTSHHRNTLPCTLACTTNTTIMHPPLALRLK